MAQKPLAGGAFRGEETGCWRSRAPVRVCAAAAHFLCFPGAEGLLEKEKGDGVAAVSGRGPLSVGNLIKFSDFCDGSQ